MDGCAIPLLVLIVAILLLRDSGTGVDREKSVKELYDERLRAKGRGPREREGEE